MGLTLAYVIGESFVSKNTFALAVMAGSIGRPDLLASAVVLATGPGNPPAVRVWNAKTDRIGSRPGPKPNLLTLGGPNPDL